MLHLRTNNINIKNTSKQKDALCVLLLEQDSDWESSVIEMNRSNIVLVGMPGVGKSTLGIVLAKTLKKPFVDTDLVIQEREDRFLQEIINDDGLEAFLKIEEEAVLSLKVRNHVIATGGSVIYSPAAMAHLKKDGTIIYLKLPLSTIEKRIRNITTRGIVMGKGRSLQDLYEERAALYEAYADLVVDCSGRRDEDLIGDLVARLKDHAVSK